MKYDEHRAKFWEKYNPFLFDTIDKNLIIDQTKYSFVLANRWPYTEDHLLVIPKREVNFLLDLSVEEKTDLYNLLDKWLAKLYKKYKGINILLRDGVFSKFWWKSVNHLHYHLIPEIMVSAREAIDRKFLSEEEFFDFTQKIKQEYGN